MLTSIRSRDKIKVLARDVQKDDGPFFCPECKEETIIRKGMMVIHHFAHKPDATCQYGSVESKFHKECKQEIYDCLLQENRVKNCELEKSFGVGAVRPDIYFEINGIKVAIEVQISDLPMETIIERTKRYHRLGIYVLWLAVDPSKHPRLKPWVKWLHATYFGRVYYWKGNLEVDALHSNKGDSDTFYPQTLHILEDFCKKDRGSWQGGNLVIPNCKLFMDNRETWWEKQQFKPGFKAAKKLYTQGMEQENKAQYKEALESYKQALDIYQDIGNQKRSEASTLFNMGDVYFELKQLKKALEVYEEALEIKKDLGVDYLREYVKEDACYKYEALSLNNIGFCYYHLHGYYQKCIEACNQSLNLLKKIKVSDYKWISKTSCQYIGLSFYRMEEYDNAIVAYEQCLQFTQNYGDAENTEILCCLIRCYAFGLKEKEKSVDLCNQVLALLQERYCWTIEEEEIDDFFFVASIFSRFDYPEKAIECYQLLIAAKEFGTIDADYEEIYYLMGNTYYYGKQYTDAIRCYKEALEILKQTKNRKREVMLLTEIGKVYYLLKQYEDAINSCQKSLDIQIEIDSQNKEFFNIGIIEKDSLYEEIFNIGIIADSLYSLGQYQLAINFFKRFFGVLKQITYPFDILERLTNLALSYKFLGQYDEAIETFDECLELAKKNEDIEKESLCFSMLCELAEYVNHQDRENEIFLETIDEDD